jgi:starch-binding outer membrane protein, SusD/RagB family
MTHTSFRIAAFAVALAGCSATDTILEAVDPDLINPPDTRSAEGAQAMYFGALNRLRQMTGGTGGEGSTWLFGGLLADEWSTSSTFVQNDETDQRNIQINNSTVTGMYRDLARARTSANQAIALLNEFRPTETNRIAEMYFVRGFAEMQLASDFCNGLALSNGAGEVIEYGEQMTVAEVFAIAEASFDSAIALVPGTGAADVLVNRAARIGKARALLGLGSSAQRIAAGALVANIPTSFTYNVTFATTSGDLVLWSQPFSARRYSVGDSLEGNGRNLLVANAIPFFAAQDPRVPARYTVSANGRDTTRSQDGLTFSRTTTLWGRTTPTPVANGIDARMIEAEGLLESGDVAGWLAIHNALRAAPPALGTITPAAMPALVDPGTPAARVSLHFREKAFWTFSRGHRLGDMRRLIRQYGRTPETVFPTGVHFRGGNYGPDVNLPVPQAEQNNPNVGIGTPTCTDRNA